LAWFEVATDDPDGAQRFSGSLFDWSFDADGPAAGGMDYRNIKAAGADGPMGGIFGTAGRVPGHAVFYILVADVGATCADAEQLRGSVISKHLNPGPGAPRFAYLRDRPATSSASSARRRADVALARRARPRRRLPAGTTPATSTTISPTTCSTTPPAAGPPRWATRACGWPLRRVTSRLR